MIARLSALLLVAVAATPNLHYFRYDRPIQNTPQSQQACVALDPTTFAHAGPQLASLRLYNGNAETPYAINYAAPAESAPKSIAILNAGLRGGATSFDAAMPDGPYRDVNLNINARDFIGTVRVAGSHAQGAPATNLGSYTIFDFTRQRLGRSTVLHLPQSDFRYLHFRIDGPIRPDEITGISAGRLPAGERQYVTVAASSDVRQDGRDSILQFAVPANVPVDRIVFAPGAQPVNFSRGVTVTIASATTRPATDAEEPPQPIISSGNILRIHSIQNGHRIDEEYLSIDAPYAGTGYAATLPADTATEWTIAIHNEDDEPIVLRSVTLQMVARNLCFAAQSGAAYALYYGDPALSAPHYDYAELFALDKGAAHPDLGPEQPNPQYQARPDTRPFTEKHPALLWIVLIATIIVLGVIALRSSKQLTHQ